MQVVTEHSRMSGREVGWNRGHQETGYSSFAVTRLFYLSNGETSHTGGFVWDR